MNLFSLKIVGLFILSIHSITSFSMDFISDQAFDNVQEALKVIYKEKPEFKQEIELNLRSARKAVWLATPMPEKLMLCTTKQQTNCLFLVAVNEAAVESQKNHELIAWMLQYRKNRVFSHYMDRGYQGSHQEYHLNPEYVAKYNRDKKTLELLEQNGHSQKKIKSGVFYFPNPLLWACMGNDHQAANTALNNGQTMQALIKDKELILDCVHTAMQNGDDELISLLFKHYAVQQIFFNKDIIKIDSSNILAMSAIEKNELFKKVKKYYACKKQIGI